MPRDRQEFEKGHRKKPSDTDRILHEIHIVRGLAENNQEQIERVRLIAVEINDKLPTSTTPHASRLVIHVTAVELKRKENTQVPAIDHMPPLQLPASTVRAKLSVVDARKPDGSRVDSVTWSTSDESQLPLEAIADSTVQGADPNWVDPGDGTSAPIIELLDPNDNLPLKVFSTYANTPLDAGSGTVTVKSAGMADCDIKIDYSDPPVGHFAIVGVQAAEE